jgi:hypothetical protein
MRDSSKPRPFPIFVVALALAASLGGCSDLYFDRREAIALHAGDAVAANKAAQIIDPWPPEAGDRRIEANGERMQRAIERYRTNKVTPLPTSGNPVQFQPVLAPVPQAGATPPQQ